jgi:catechol 2,3-dioxygenase-like lactoylglutathione lyase family enzyme
MAWTVRPSANGAGRVERIATTTSQENPVKTSTIFVAVVSAAAVAVLAVAPAQSADAQLKGAGSRTPLGTRTEQVLLAKITVSDLPKSYEFYTKIIGLKWALSIGQPPPAAPVKANNAQPSFIEIPMNFTGSLADPFFVLVQQRGSKPGPDTAKMSWIGFKVPDAPAAVQRVRAAGYEVIREPATVGPGEMSIGIVRDPDGYTVELIQSASYAAASR